MSGELQIPKLNLTEIIKMVVDVSTGKKEPLKAAAELAIPYKSWAAIFVVDQAKQVIESGLASAGMVDLAGEDFAERLVAAAGSLGALIKGYLNDEVSETDLVSGLGESGIRDLAVEVLRALGVAEKMGCGDLTEIAELPPTAVAYAALMAAYKEYRKALDDLELAKEERLRIEKECEEAIAMIREYKGEIERIVNKYLAERLEVFESGFDAMERAIIENDVDGYILGNVEIQRILGREIQFSNMDEFDKLMDSDEAFKL